MYACSMRAHFIKRNAKSFPFFDIDSCKVFGMTYKMIGFIDALYS
jgi:hypothetical protein